MNEEQILAQVAAHRRRNDALLKAIVNHGAAVDERRQTDHFFNVPSAANAKALASDLVKGGFDQFKHSKSGAFLWQKHRVEAVLLGSPREVTDDRFVENLIRIASRHDSEYDGWRMSLD